MLAKSDPDTEQDLCHSKRVGSYGEWRHGESNPRSFVSPGMIILRVAEDRDATLEDFVAHEEGEMSRE